MSSNTRLSLLDRIRDPDNVLAWEEFWNRYWPLAFNFASELDRAWGGPRPPRPGLAMEAGIE